MLYSSKHVSLPFLFPYVYATAHELTRMSALHCSLLNSLDAIKFDSPLTVFSLEVFSVRIDLQI